VEARKLWDNLKTDGCNKEEGLDRISQSLDFMGYNEAAQYVYGMNYGDWKERH
jgi:hypothetical protein